MIMPTDFATAAAAVTTKYSSQLLNAGFIIRPEPEAVAALKADGLALPPQTPVLSGSIPNLAEFAIGPDIGSGGVKIKSANSDICYVPASHAPALATIQAMVNNAYATGHGGDNLVVRYSRRTTPAKEAFQNEFEGWHTHPELALDACVQLAASALGTEFKQAGEQIIAAPDAAIVMFDGNTIHRSPISAIPQRRTLLSCAAVGTSDKIEKQLNGARYQSPLQALLLQERLQSYPDQDLATHWQRSADAVISAQRAQQTPAHRTARNSNFMPR
jgi:hypothetical protein